MDIETSPFKDQRGFKKDPKLMTDNEACNYTARDKGVADGLTTNYGVGLRQPVSKGFKSSGNTVPYGKN